MDGNRRYARASGLTSVSQGHLKGAEKLFDVLNWCYDFDVRMVTVWSFSLDNFHRDTSEVEALLQLFEEKTRELADSEEVHGRELRVRFLGQLDLLPESLQTAIGSPKKRPSTTPSVSSTSPWPTAVERRSLRRSVAS